MSNPIVFTKSLEFRFKSQKEKEPGFQKETFNILKHERRWAPIELSDNYVPRGRSIGFQAI